MSGGRARQVSSGCIRVLRSPRRWEKKRNEQYEESRGHFEKQGSHKPLIETQVAAIVNKIATDKSLVEAFEGKSLDDVMACAGK